MGKKSSSSYHISDADRALFRAAVATIRPQRPVTQASRASDAMEEGFSFVDEWPETVLADTALRFARSGVPARLLSQLQRGKLSPAWELDLHGLTVAQARTALGEFLQQALQRQYRCLCIIHGKSRRADTPPPLKNYLNGWLRQHPAVLAFCSAPPAAGGTGAVYVWLQKKHFAVTLEK